MSCVLTSKCPTGARAVAGCFIELFDIQKCPCEKS